MAKRTEAARAGPSQAGSGPAGARARRPSTPSPRRAAESRDRRDERVREIAYDLYLRRGAADGRALDDWVEAEAQYEREGGDRQAAAAAREGH